MKHMKFTCVAMAAVISCLWAGRAIAQDESAVETTAVAVGTVAPDFTAETDGEDEFSLSGALQENDAVALVFVRAHW
jgi:hypothetical protein